MNPCHQAARNLLPVLLIATLALPGCDQFEVMTGWISKAELERLAPNELDEKAGQLLDRRPLLEGKGGYRMKAIITWTDLDGRNSSSHGVEVRWRESNGLRTEALTAPPNGADPVLVSTQFWMAGSGEWITINHSGQAVEIDPRPKGSPPAPGALPMLFFTATEVAFAMPVRADALRRFFRIRGATREADEWRIDAERVPGIKGCADKETVRVRLDAETLALRRIEYDTTAGRVTANVTESGWTEEIKPEDFVFDEAAFKARGYSINRRSVEARPEPKKPAGKS